MGSHLLALSPARRSPLSLGKILSPTMHLLLTFMVGSCVAMSVRKSPYVYQSNPMARMSMQARHHSGGNDWNTRSKNPFSYMVGKEFFKNENHDGDHFDHFEGHFEEQPYSVTQNYGNYEKRHYPEAAMACTYDLVDLEMLLMCFYLPSDYQLKHSHPHKETKPNQQARHASISAPTPMEDSRVEIITRPEIDVYVRTFDGFALTADSWEHQRQILLDDLIGKKVKHDEFFCSMYNSPMEMTNRRNEVWVQAEDGDASDVSSVVHQLLHDELPHHENHPHPHQ